MNIKTKQSSGRWRSEKPSAGDINVNQKCFFHCLLQNPRASGHTFCVDIIGHCAVSFMYSTFLVEKFVVCYERLYKLKIQFGPFSLF